MNSAAVRFQRQREADELLRYQTEEVTRRKLLNRRAAQEEAGLLRAAQAREERMDDASLEKSVEHKKERRAKLKALYKREWDGWVANVEAEANEKDTLEDLRYQVGEMQYDREQARQRVLKEKQLQRLAQDDTLRPWTAQARLEAVVNKWESDEEVRRQRQADAVAHEQGFMEGWTPTVKFRAEPTREEAWEKKATDKVVQSAW